MQPEAPLTPPNEPEHTGPRQWTQTQVSQIYPTAATPAAPQAAPAPPGQGMPGTGEGYTPTGTIAQRVPAVKQLAIIEIILSIVSGGTIVFFFLLLFALAGGTDEWKLNLFTVLFLGIGVFVTILPIILGVVLLTSKSKNAVSGILTVLIVIWVIGIASSIAKPSVQTVVSVIINGLLISRALAAKKAVNALM